MDNDICPLCCEELDMSDRQFFPCKCGYQVCMWCWHRIREQETGLCPACRTPYGDDPHEFSAVDVEEVLKANKEKLAAEKKEKERVRQQQMLLAGSNHSILSSGNPTVTLTSGSGSLAVGDVVGGMHVGGGSDSDQNLVLFSSGNRVSQEPPKDRNQLANMRVIRRNLVYAVGLPPSLATEDVLKKPEYFGQYGKISKIVLNRSHTIGTDPRRASASAYVTFVHKEDALACIVALDGFYLDGRNIRASYGTSKYCSAFIKNVRCNNPDCTYLHSMGESDDTFTKQEIQAGYVTSGRDVSYRQQQLLAAANSTTSKRKVGGGGPSGTGKIATNPVFPPPTYDEPTKASQFSMILVPPSSLATAQFPPVGNAPLTRSMSSSITGFSAVASAGLAPLSKAPRSQSLSGVDSLQSDFDDETIAYDEINNNSPSSEIAHRQQELIPRNHPQSISFKDHLEPNTNMLERVNSQSQNLVAGPSLPLASASSATIATAASVVAGIHSTARSQPLMPPPHTTLTPLTPLKRVSSTTEKKDILSVAGAASSKAPISGYANSNVDASSHIGVSLKSVTPSSDEDLGFKQTALRSGTTSSPSSSISSSEIAYCNTNVGDDTIGGIVIRSGGSTTVVGSNRFPSTQHSNSLGRFGAVGLNSAIGNLNSGSFDQGSFLGSSLGTQGGIPIGNNKNDVFSLGGSATDGINSSAPFKNDYEDRWASQANPDHAVNIGPVLGSNNDKFLIPVTSRGGWESTGYNKSSAHAAIGPSTQQTKLSASGVIGGGRSSIGGTVLTPSTSLSPGILTGPSILGNGSLGNGTSGSSVLASMLGIELPTGSGSLRDSLWETPLTAPPSVPSKSSIQPPPPIGSGIRAGGDVILGKGAGVPITGLGSSRTLGATRNNNDMALLQSLLPGVHITSGTIFQSTPSVSTINDHTNNSSAYNAGWLGPSVSDSFTTVPMPSKSNELIGFQPNPHLQQPRKGFNDAWGSSYLSSVNIPQNSAQNQQLYNTQQYQQQNQHHPANIW